MTRKLEEDLQSKTGKLKKEVANKYSSGTIEKTLKGHKLSATCVVISSNSKYLFSGSKDGSIIKCILLCFRILLFKVLKIFIF